MVDPSFQQLQLEFVRLDILLHRQVERQQANAAASPAGEQSAYHLSDDQAYTLLQRPFGNTTPALGVETAYTEALTQAEANLACLINQAQQDGQRLRFHDL